MLYWVKIAWQSSSNNIEGSHSKALVLPSMLKNLLFQLCSFAFSQSQQYKGLSGHESGLKGTIPII